MSKAALIAAAALAMSGGVGNYYDRLWVDGVSAASRHRYTDRSYKRAGKGTHKQNARKQKKGARA